MACPFSGRHNRISCEFQLTTRKDTPPFSFLQSTTFDNNSAPTGDVFVVGGAPGAIYFYKKLSGNSYGRPEGAFATLTRYGASNNQWERLHIDGSREYYSWVTSLGYARLDSVRAGGRITKIAYRSGSSGSPATITDPQGKQIRFDYTGSGVGALSKICAPAGANERCTTFIYGTSGGNTVVTAIKDPDNVQTTFGYDGPHWALIKTFTPRAHGAYTINYHGAVNRASGVTMPSSSDVLSYTAPQLAGFALTGGTVGSPAAASYADSGWGSVARPLGQTAYFSADRFGGVRFSKDPAGVVTDIWHGLDGQVTRVARNFQVLQYTSYNGMGAALWTRLENGDTTFFTYGGACATGTGYPCFPTQRVLRRPPTAPDTLKWSYTTVAYDSAWGPDSAYRSAFGWTHYTRESSGLRRLINVTDPRGHETNYAYESTWGNTRYVIRDSAKVCSPTCAWDRDTTVFEPNSQGRTWWTRRGATGRRAEYAYDTIGRVTSVRDSTGGASVIMTQTIYNDAARTITVRDGSNHDIVSLFDTRGRRIRRTDAAAARDTFAYDGNDRLTSWTNRRNQTITYSYDSFNRLRTKGVPGSGTWTYGYNTTHGTLDTLLTPDASIYRVRDFLGRMTEERTVVNSVTRTVKYVYDDAGNVTSMTDPWNGVYNYGWVPGTRSRTVNNPFSESFTIRYNEDGLITRVLFPTSSDSMTYSDEHRVLSAGYNGEITYQRDPVTHGINRITSPNGPGTVNQRFGYDGFERLYTDSITTLGTVGETFTYDAAGNRTGSPGTYNYATTNAATGRPAISGDATYSPGDSLVYDATGNPIWWKNKTTGGYDSLTWDPESRLTRFRRYSSGGTLQADVQFRYDGFGRRVKKQVGSTVTLFVWDGWELLAETNATGGALRRYTMNPDAIDFPLAVRDGSSSYWMHRDGQGNVYRVDNSSGVLRSSYRYRGWGDRYQVGSENYQSQLTYKGREEDRETGLIYIRHRYYSPRLERFLNEDPIGVAGGRNLYRFAAGDPCNSGDPSGLGPKCNTDFDQRLTPEVLAKAREQVADSETKSLDARNQQGDPYEWLGIVVGAGEDGSFALRDKTRGYNAGWRGEEPLSFNLDSTEPGYATAAGTIYHTHVRTVLGGAGFHLTPSYRDLTRGRDPSGAILTSFIFHHTGAFRIQWQTGGSLDRIDSCSY